MTASLMLYALWTGALLAGGAFLAHALLRGAGIATRFVWAVALAATAGLVLIAPARARHAAVSESSATVEIPVEGAARTPSPSGRDVRAPAAWTDLRLPVWADRSLAALWVASSLAALLALALTYRRHRRRLGEAEGATIEGVPVRVTDAFGPAVIGIRDPQVVVPRWLLARPLHEQRLVVRHEREHIAVGDPALLLAACVTVAAMPWNPALWYMLSRLRLAMELDCDARLLRAGAPAAAYGALLIDLTALLPRPRVGAPAFAGRPSHLERRLVAMTARPKPFRRARVALAAAAAALVAVAACESDLPTAAEVEAMDVTAAEVRIGAVPEIEVANAIYLVDGKVVTRAEAAAVDPAAIRSIEVQRGGVETPRIHISTVERPLDSTLQETPVTGRTRVPFIIGRDGRAASEQEVVVERAQAMARTNGEKPLVVIDGVIASEDAIRALKPGTLFTIEVLKGAAAAARFGERGAHGAILVTTGKRR